MVQSAPSAQPDVDLLQGLAVTLDNLHGSNRETERVTGQQVGDPEEFTECLPAGSATDCQAGLTISHKNAWKALAGSGEYAAWIFE